MEPRPRRHSARHTHRHVSGAACNTVLRRIVRGSASRRSRAHPIPSGRLASLTGPVVPHGNLRAAGSPCLRLLPSKTAMARAMSAASSASSHPVARSRGSRTSRSTRSSTAARSRPASPRRRAATSWRCATRASSTRSSTSRSCARCRATWRSATSATAPPAPTRGRTRSRSTAPIEREVALGHNGNLVNVVELHQELREKGVTFRSTSDSEIIAALVSTHEADTVEDALVDVIGRVEGAYSTVVMTDDRVVAFRDPLGPAPAVARHARRHLLRGERDLRVRHHRRQVPARRPAGRDRLDHKQGHPDAPGGPVAALARCASSSTSTSRGPTPASAARSSRSRAGRWARSWPRKRRSRPTW